MSVRAYPMIEREIDGHTWRRMGDDSSFNLWRLDQEEEQFLFGIRFMQWLGDGATGYTEVCIEDIDEYLETLRPEERYRIREIVDIIKTDIKDNDGSYIQYNVG